MPQRDRDDVPWKDVAADNVTLGTDPEPDPADVAGDEDDDAVVDTAAHRVPDPYDKYREETLDQRLAEEEPEATLRGEEDPQAGELQTATDPDEDVELGELDDDDDEGDEGAEDAAIHVHKRI